MRVVILLLNRGRGSGEVARQHAAELRRLGHEVVFLHPDMNDGVAGADNRNVILHGSIRPVHEYLPSAGDDQRAVSSMTEEEALAFLPDYTTALEEVIAGADIVIGHHGNISSVAAGDVAQRHSVPYVLFLHGTGIEPRLHGGYDDAVWARIEGAIRAASGILVTTDYVRDELVRPLVDLDQDRFLVLPCGVDTTEFAPQAVGDIRAAYDLPATFVISPGAVTDLKGTPNVVEASRRYADLAPTIFIGDGDLRPELERALGDRGRFLGFVPARDKAALINAATVLVAAPNKLEHFGIIYIEGMAGGSVPVAYGGGGVESIVTSETGLLTERDPTVLGDAVRALLADPDRTRRLAGAARERAETIYDAPRLGVILGSWLEEIAT